jgi:E3 ubiquitin-protein ligase DOA10
MEIFERIRFARDQALEAERSERRRLAEADNADLQRAASVRLATRQAVREALDDVLDERSDPEADLDPAAAGAA